MRRGDILAGNRRFVVWGRSVWWRTYRPGGFDGYRTLTGRRLPCHTLELAVCHPELAGDIKKLAVRR